MFIEADTRTIVEQIGMPTVLAISGGRVEHRDTGITLPVSNGYRVTVDLAAGDTYTVRRIFERGGKTWIKGELTGVYAEQLSEIAYQAHAFRSYEFPQREQPVEWDAQRKRAVAIKRAGHVMTMIHDDQRRGVVPDAVASFGQLHDHVDANDYLIQTLAVYFADERAAREAADAEIITPDAEMDIGNMISDIVDARLLAEAERIVASDDVEPAVRAMFAEALAHRAADPQYAPKPRLTEVEPPVAFVGVSDPDGGVLVMPVFSDPDGPDRNGAFDGFQVISDADEGL